jgi:hypothetical protein
MRRVCEEKLKTRYGSPTLRKKLALKIHYMKRRDHGAGEGDAR